MKTSFSSRLIFSSLILVFWCIQSVTAQYICSSPHSIPSVPFFTSILSTSSGPSYQVSGFCGQNTNYNEKDYIFEYTPVVDEFIEIYAEAGNNSSKMGIYVFTDCDQPPTECVDFVEASSDNVTLSVIVNADITYYIIIGTDTTENFFLEVSKESVNGVAINKSEPTQTLDVNGSIRIGEGTTTPYAGTIQWNETAGRFEGYTGTEWISLSPEKDFGVSTSKNYGFPVSATGNLPEIQYGFSVAIDGNYAIVGAPLYNDKGAVYIYHLQGEEWVFEKLLAAADGATNDQFGYSISISGESILVGARNHDINGNTNQGKSYVYEKVNDNWSEVAQLIASDGESGDAYGSSVCIKNDLIIIGAPYYSSAFSSFVGKAYIYQKSGSTWNEQEVIMASNADEENLFGFSVQISESYAVVGAPEISANISTNNSISDKGKAYVYKKNGSSWNNESILTPSSSQSFDRFGYSLSLYNNYLAIGSPHGEISIKGSLYIFELEGGIWNEKSKLSIFDSETSDDQFGSSVSMSAELLVVGANKLAENGIPSIGKAYIFQKSGDTWIEKTKLEAYDGAANDRLGNSVSISGNNIIVGAHLHDTNGNNQQGKVYFY